MGQTCLQSFARISILRQISPMSVEGLYFIAGATKRRQSHLISLEQARKQMLIFPVSWIKLDPTRVRPYMREANADVSNSWIKLNCL